MATVDVKGLIIKVVRTQLSNKTYTYYQLGIFIQLSDNKMPVIEL